MKKLCELDDSCETTLVKKPDGKSIDSSDQTDSDHCVDSKRMAILTRIQERILNRQCDRPDTPPINLDYQSDFFQEKEIDPTSKKIGFLGLGKISQGIVKHLHHSGHRLVIWNERRWECEDFNEKFGIDIADTPAELITVADIIFSRVSDSEHITLEDHNWGNKDFVEMTPMDPELYKSIAHTI